MDKRKRRKKPESLDSNALKDNLLALGIDIDHQLIQRMHKLGLSSALLSTSQVADSIRSRNPYGMSSAIIYQNIEDKSEYLCQEKKEIELEWNPLDTQRIFHIFSDLFQSGDTSKVGVQNMIQILRIQYARSGDLFIDRMLASKNHKGYLTTSDVMRTRYVIFAKFSEIICRLYKYATSKDLEMLFHILAQYVEIGGVSKLVVDLKAFLFILKIANEDSRRSYEDKTSQISTDVEFWNQRRAPNPNGSTNSPTPPQVRRIRTPGIYSSKGLVYSESMTPRGKGSFHSFLKDRTELETSLTPKDDTT